MINFYNENLTWELFLEGIHIMEKSKEEVYLNKDDLTLFNNMNFNNIDFVKGLFESRLELQNQGLLHLSTMRYNEQLVGYWCLGMMFHSQADDLLVAKCQNLHIIKEHRGLNSIKFMKFTEESLKKRGVKQIYFGVNPQLGTDKLLERMKYSLDEVVYTKGL